ncbi:hypothetical protein AKN87_07450 [Thiopseudomonas alkaliphila]|uniref:hypothetical protein n=1 Tax=Thiopseudomonas alkaliphila TaxID=1697053 RepID=UPI00069FC432|nr:hypothetical protein [Thiopseudomonas alkaliphila]AKX44944.1 hypothetical protein AKN87_07450 [Thiopseudomonas alkaliphila]
MTKALVKEINKIKSRLEKLKTEDDATAKEIHADFFTLIKTTEAFDEYLERINNQKFTFECQMYNTGHSVKREKFNLAKQGLLNIAKQILREIKYGALKPKLLPKPETVSIHWLFKNGSLSFWGVVFLILLSAFCAGAVTEQQTGKSDVVIKVIKNPLEYLESLFKENKD